MTEKDFTERMKNINELTDVEARHREADELLCQALRDLGYKEGLEIYDNMKMWYA